MAFSEEQKKTILNIIFASIADGNSLRSICANAPEDFPHRDTINEWIKANEYFSDQYARAMEKRQESLFEEIIDIADKSIPGVPDELIQDDMVTIQRDKLKIETRKWILGKMNPKKYGERAIIEGDKENPLQLNISLKDMVSFTDKSAPEI